MYNSISDKSSYPPVAKLDIATDSDSGGRGFESLRAGHIGASYVSLAPIFKSKNQSALTPLLLLFPKKPFGF